MVRAVRTHTEASSGRLLEIGPGGGELLAELARELPGWRLLGVELSQRNVLIAGERLRSAGLSDRVTLVVADYVTGPGRGVFDVIVAQSVLHLITTSDLDLCRRLGNDLSPRGLLVITIPYDCWYNRCVWLSRRVLRHMPSALVDRLGEAVGRLVHPALDPELVRQRLPYLRSVPHRVDSPAFRSLLRDVSGLGLVEAVTLARRSPAQPRHRLLVFTKAP